MKDYKSRSEHSFLSIWNYATFWNWIVCLNLRTFKSMIRIWRLLITPLNFHFVVDISIFHDIVFYVNICVTVFRCKINVFYLTNKSLSAQTQIAKWKTVFQDSGQQSYVVMNFRKTYFPSVCVQCLDFIHSILSN